MKLCAEYYAGHNTAYFDLLDKLLQYRLADDLLTTLLLWAQEAQFMGHYTKYYNGCSVELFVSYYLWHCSGHTVN
jgi:hypothetical protein